MKFTEREEGGKREERAAAHGKHMSCLKKKYKDVCIYRGKRGGRGGGLERQRGWEGCEAGTG